MRARDVEVAVHVVADDSVVEDLRLLVRASLQRRSSARATRRRNAATNLLGSKVTAFGDVEDGELSLVTIANGSTPAQVKSVSVVDSRARARSLRSSLVRRLQISHRRHLNPRPLLRRRRNVLDVVLLRRERLGPVGGSLLASLLDHLNRR